MMSYEKKQPALNDIDNMPFGKHKGQPMQDIPASYLKWLHTNIKEQGGPNSSNQMVFNYIHNSQDALRQEGVELD